MDGETVEKRTMLDRISDLPNSVIDNILSRVPLRVAVRTSILSRKWRLHWTRVENLVLDHHFFDEILSGLDELYPTGYISIVRNILLSHCGPIRKFHLHIPYFNDPVDVINLWILVVSRHGVQDLTLDYDEDMGRTVPSSVFQCMELKHLSLQHVELERSPHNFGKLYSLISLDLYCHCEEISGDLVTNIILNCPLLESLSLIYIRNDGTFAINASKLKVLCVTYYEHSDFALKNTPNLSTVSLMSWAAPHDKKCPGIVDFFGAVPKIENITLTGTVLEEWGVQDIPKMLSVPLVSHMSLTVSFWNMCSLPQVRSMLYLIKSLPILQTLDISMHRPCYPPSPPHDTSDYLKSQIRRGENKWSLRTVKLAWLVGIELEILLIGMILYCCPVLEKLYLSSDPRISSDAELKMMTDISQFHQFHRASAQAEMIFSKSEEQLDGSS
ncbi:unnamed protein product [Rhodiola kirilowii]